MEETMMGWPLGRGWFMAGVGMGVVAFFVRYFWPS